jgi:hypothetical protein
MYASATKYIAIANSMADVELKPVDVGDRNPTSRE